MLIYTRFITIVLVPRLDYNSKSKAKLYNHILFIHFLLPGLAKRSTEEVKREKNYFEMG